MEGKIIGGKLKGLQEQEIERGAVIDREREKKGKK